MKYLLDTHIMLWAFADHKNLSKEARDIILNPNNQIYYSAVSPWEIEIKHLKSPDTFSLTGEQVVFLCEQSYYINLPIQTKHIKQLKNIKPLGSKIKHNLFDKMLLAQAIEEDMILLTHDSKFENYNIKNLQIV